MTAESRKIGLMAAQKTIARVPATGNSRCKACLQVIDRGEQCIRIVMSPFSTCYIHSQCVAERILAPAQAIIRDARYEAEGTRKTIEFPKSYPASYNNLIFTIQPASGKAYCFCCGKTIQQAELFLAFQMYHSRAYSHHRCLDKLVNTSP
jgi:hypothetical protein